MDILNMVRGWIAALVALFLAVVPLAVVLQVLFGNAARFGTDNVVGNLVNMLDAVAAKGLVGLIALFIVIWLFRFLNIRSV